MLIRTPNSATRLLFIFVGAFLVLQPARLATTGLIETGIRATMSGSALDAPQEAAVPLSLVRAHYFLEVIGSTARGTLQQEFSNDTSLARRSVYSATGMAGLNTVDLQYEIDGERTAALEDAQSGPTTEGARQKDPRTSAAAGDSTIRGRAIEVAAGQTVIVRTEFRLEVPLVEGRSRLQLPVVLTETPQATRTDSRRAGSGPAAAGEAEPRPRLEPAPLSITINVHHDRSLTEVDSPSHELMVSFEGDRTVIEPARMPARSRKSFELVYSLGADYDAALLAYAGPDAGDGRQVVLELTPPSRPWSGLIRSKQVLFVVDTSGSMGHGKLDQARRAITSCIEKLSYDDQYNIVGFASQPTLLRPEPTPVSSLHPSQANSWLESLVPEGGTRLFPALEETLRQPDSADHHRMIVVLTDGLMIDEEKVLDFLKTKLGSGRLFVVGVGDDVRRDTIRRLAEYGRGTAAFAADAGVLDEIVERLFDSVAAPLAWDLAIDWGGATLHSLEPPRLPDLYAGRAVKVVARVSGDLPAEITMRGTTVDGEVIWSGHVQQLGGEAARAIPAPRQPATTAPPVRSKTPENR